MNIKDNVVDFKEYKRLLKKQLKVVHKMAQKKKLKHILKKKYVNDVKDLDNTKIFKNDYVILKTNYKGKHEPNYQYGWVVIKVNQTKNQLKPTYTIKNIFTDDELTVNKGRIMRFHKPIINPMDMINDECTRLRDLSGED